MLEEFVSHLSAMRAPSRISTVGGSSLTDWSLFFWVAAVLMILALPPLAYRIFMRWRSIEAVRRETAPAVAARLVAGPTSLVGMATVEDDCADDPIVLVSDQTGKRAATDDEWSWTESKRQLLERHFFLVLDGDARRVRVATDARVKQLGPPLQSTDAPSGRVELRSFVGGAPGPPTLLRG